MAGYLATKVAALEGDVQGSKTRQIPVAAFRIWNNLDVQLSATPASADDLALIIGTYGTDSPYITTTAQTPGDANPVVSYARLVLPVPDNYQAGSAISLVLTWERPDAAATSMTIDAEVFRNVAPTVDIQSTAAASINAAASGTFTGVLTPTDLVPGELINIRVAITAVSNGASYEGRITKAALSYSV